MLLSSYPDLYLQEVEVLPDSHPDLQEVEVPGEEPVDLEPDPGAAPAADAVAAAVVAVAVEKNNTFLLGEE